MDVGFYLIDYSTDIINMLSKKLGETLEFTLRGAKDCSNFSEDWREHLRKASYYAFFIHYGAKRKGESYTDEHGDSHPKDYVRHVVGSAFRNLIAKGRTFCEQMTVAEIFHDTLEDWDRGLLSLVAIEDAAELRAEALENKPDWLSDKQKKLKNKLDCKFGQHFKDICVDDRAYVWSILES